MEETHRWPAQLSWPVQRFRRHLGAQLSEQTKQVRRTSPGPQQDTRAQHSRCDGTSGRERSAQSKQDRFPF